MNRTSRSARFLSGMAAVSITAVLFQGVAGLSRPAAIERMALARAQAITVAMVAPTAPAMLRQAPR